MIKCKVTMIDGKKHLKEFSQFNTMKEVRVWLNGGADGRVILADYIDLGDKLIINRHHIIRLVKMENK